ncbi:DUF4160 domain-containing protein [Brevundimonas halotolerans]|uniref:DUF4160 domain-containing protein n=1 Tax=Brevundimonas halotolerans TaxID=69670 RepID=A0A7W9E6F6_9CAUL|nr:DUF4160 domain-containing protein [Brevundimonas halotolerans]MBB5660262.1 hypothetical protein [Brevundimonas halotolerans]
MPTIAFFYGIAIRMYFNDHAPAHVHAYHGGLEARFDIATGKMIDGRLGRKQRKIVENWILMYGRELNAAWTAVRNDETPERIPGPDTDHDI